MFEIKSIYGDVLFVSETASTVLQTLVEAVESRANLSRANLSRANLSEADLYGANLYGVNLYGVNLYGANLSEANLYGANLSEANLYGANLSEADLSGANLSGASLSGAKGADVLRKRFSILPDEGDVIGWKKCQNGVIVKLLIPNGVERSNATGRKCRAECADVLEVIGDDVGYSTHDFGKTTYKKGERVVCHEWNPDWTVECGGGIHFFITRQEAEEY